MSVFNISGSVSSNFSSAFPWLKPEMWHSIRVVLGSKVSTLHFDHDDDSFLSTESLNFMSNMSVYGPVYVDEVVLKHNQSLQKCYPTPSSIVASTFFPDSINYPNSIFSPLNQQLSRSFRFDALPWSFSDISSVYPSTTGMFAVSVTLTGSGFSFSPYSLCIFDFGSTTLSVPPVSVIMNAVVCHSVLATRQS